MESCKNLSGDSMVVISTSPHVYASSNCVRSGCCRVTKRRFDIDLSDPNYYSEKNNRWYMAIVDIDKALESLFRHLMCNTRAAQPAKEYT